MEKKEWLIIGKVIGTHGLQGNLKVYSYAESLEAFKSKTQILIKDIHGTEHVYTINWSKPYKKAVLLSLNEVSTRNQSELLKGAELFIDKTLLPDLDEGVYYWYDIIGLKVFTESKQYIGSIDSVITTGSNDVYVVKNNEDKEILIPALEDVVLSIDLDNQKMVVRLPEGL